MIIVQSKAIETQSSRSSLLSKPRFISVTSNAIDDRLVKFQPLISHMFRSPHVLKSRLQSMLVYPAHEDLSVDGMCRLTRAIGVRPYGVFEEIKRHRYVSEKHERGSWKQRR